MTQRALCGIRGCRSFSDRPYVAMCDRHFARHWEAMVSRRQGSPFTPPKTGGRKEMVFNYISWFWYQGYWRPWGAS